MILRPPPTRRLRPAAATPGEAVKALIVATDFREAQLDGLRRGRCRPATPAVIGEHALHAIELVDPPFEALGRIAQEMFSLGVEHGLESVGHGETPGKAEATLAALGHRAKKLDAARHAIRPLHN
ncbi:hypothetical protein ACVWZV_001151 [Bradyrhizobium sp. GM5.1]